MNKFPSLIWGGKGIDPDRIGTIFAPPTTQDSDLTQFLTEQFKGVVTTKDKKFPSDVGEEHPFDYSITEGLYEKFGLVTGVIDKYVDFVIGSGFFVKSEDERAQKIIEDFMRDVDFHSLISGWIKEALIKGNAFIEIGGTDTKINGLKVINANTMFVKRNILGVVEGYTQFIPGSGISQKEVKENFDPEQIAHLKINHVGDNAYGFGVIYPAINTINNILGSEKDMHMLIRRKAGAPYHVKIGSLTTNPPILPTQARVDEFGAKLQFLNNRHEWVTGPDTEIKAIDFGKLGENFDSVLRHDLEMFFAATQVPEVLLSSGQLNEGIAKVQKDGFERRVQSLQAEAEKVIETKIFRRVLISNGLDEHVEFEWGQPSSLEKNERIDRIRELLKIQLLNPVLKFMLEEELAVLFGFSKEELETPEEQREREETRPQPIVPGQNREEIIQIGEELEDKDYSLKEWLNFNYADYLDAINTYLFGTGLKHLIGKSATELQAGMLTASQVDTLERIFRTSFSRGQSIREIANEIARKVNPKDLFRLKNGKLVLNKKGKPILAKSAMSRAIAIARTEATRAAVEGALLHFKNGGVEKVRFVASIGPRTDAICEGLNGQIFTLVEASGMIPVHTNCRCTFVPIFGE